MSGSVVQIPDKNTSIPREKKIEKYNRTYNSFINKLQIYKYIQLKK